MPEPYIFAGSYQHARYERLSESIFEYLDDDNGGAELLEDLLKLLTEEKERLEPRCKFLAAAIEATEFFKNTNLENS